MLGADLAIALTSFLAVAAVALVAIAARGWLDDGPGI
jgi:hypothetical protein